MTYRIMVSEVLDKSMVSEVRVYRYRIMVDDKHMDLYFNRN